VLALRKIEAHHVGRYWCGRCASWSWTEV